MNCINCGAGLRPKSGVCHYCKTLNDIDLRSAFDYARVRPDETRHCPRCNEHLESLDLGLGRAFFIERCRRCLGLFFDPGELEAVIGEKAAAAPEIDFERIENILNEETPDDFSRVRYVKCPTCRDVMNRKTYGTRAGVIVDVCRPHGVWLDGGELRRILTWTRAGGEILHAKREDERRRTEERKRRFQALVDAGERANSGATSNYGDGFSAADVVCLVGSLLRRMLY